MDPNHKGDQVSCKEKISRDLQHELELRNKAVELDYDAVFCQQCTESPKPGRPIGSGTRKNWLPEDNPKIVSLWDHATACKESLAPDHNIFTFPRRGHSSGLTLVELPFRLGQIDNSKKTISRFSKFDSALRMVMFPNERERIESYLCDLKTPSNKECQQALQLVSKLPKIGLEEIKTLKAAGLSDNSLRNLNRLIYTVSNKRVKLIEKIEKQIKKVHTDAKASAPIIDTDMEELMVKGELVKAFWWRVKNVKEAAEALVNELAQKNLLCWDSSQDFGKVYLMLSCDGFKNNWSLNLSVLNSEKPNAPICCQPLCFLENGTNQKCPDTNWEFLKTLTQPLRIQLDDLKESNSMTNWEFLKNLCQ